MAPRYRRAVTPGGLEAMEKGTLEPFDLEARANVHTGLLEEYLDDRGRRTAFARRWRFRAALASVLVGAAFAAVNVFVGLKVGVLVAGGWYVAFVLHASRRAGAATTATGGATANAAAVVAAGSAFALPAAFLLALPLGGSPARVAASDIPGWALASAIVLASGWLAVFLVAIYRRAWIVEDPLPFPGAEGFARLLEMAEVAGPEGASRLRHGLRLGAAGAAAGATWAILRDAPLLRGRGDAATVLGSILPRSVYEAGVLGTPSAVARWTSVGIALSPLLAAVGWFLRLRGALALLAGSAFAWLVVVPLAVAFDVPAVAAGFQGDLRLSEWSRLGLSSAVVAFGGPVRALAAGALAGAALAALARALPAARHALRGPGPSVPAHVPGRGWYEWPRIHAATVVVAALAALAGLGVLVAGASGASLALAILALVPLVVVAVGVLGETGLEAVVGGAVALFLLAYAGATVAGSPHAALLAVLAATAFVGAAAVAAASTIDQQSGLFAGALPARILRGQALGVAAGAVVASAVAVALAGTLRAGVPIGAGGLAAPHASALDGLARMLAGSSEFGTLLVLGLVVGVALELATGIGIAFGVGMFLPFGFAAATALGGALREWWETRRLARESERQGWDEEKRTARVLDTYLLAAGIVAGEALVGIALLLLGGSARA